MRYRTLGRTGLEIAEVSLGTVQFGLPYGLPDEHGRLPMLDELASLEVLRRAFVEGVNFLDTARSYGTSEAVIGRALKKRQETVYVATKLEPLSDEMTDEEIQKTIRGSIEGSRRALDREMIDLMQVHNATKALLGREVLFDTLYEAQQKERLRFLGVSTYDVKDPEFAMTQPYWDTLQVEFNLLNQQTAVLFDEIQRQNRGLIIRSAMLKGAITADEQAIPDHLKPLAQKAKDLKAIAPDKAMSSAHIALSYVLSHPAVSTVITGVLNTDQLLENLAASKRTHWSAEQLEEAKAFNLGESALTDPRRWGF